QRQVRAPTRVALEGGDLLAPFAAGDDEERRHQLGGVEAGLADKPAESRAGAEPARPALARQVDLEAGSELRHRSSNPLWERRGRPPRRARAWSGGRLRPRSRSRAREPPGWSGARSS